MGIHSNKLDVKSTIFSGKEIDSTETQEKLFLKKPRMYKIIK